jgi:hypothetical protein
MSIYKNAFLRALLLDDGNVAGSGGPLGDWTQSHFSGDFYAPGDARRPFALGAMQRRAGVSKKKGKKKKKKRKSKKKKTTIKEKIRNVVPSHWQQPGGDEGQPLALSAETKELLTIVNRVRNDAQFAMAEYNIAEIWNGWGDNLQDKIKRELLVLDARPHKGVSEANIVLSIIKLAEQKLKNDEDREDTDPNGGHRGLSI